MDGTSELLSIRSKPAGLRTPQTIRERTSISMKRIHEQGYNKGEWAELYVFLQLLGSGRLDAADRDLQCKPGAFLEVSKVFRHEKGRPETEYVVVPEFDTVEVRCDGARVARVSMRECAEQARALFEYLTSHKGSGKVMCAPEGVCDFAEAIGVTNPKAPSAAAGGLFGGKADIVVETRDGRNALVNRMGFSVKSQFGSPSTLFNAGPNAPLLFWVANCTDELMEEFNALVNTSGKRAWMSHCQPFLAAHGLRVSFARSADTGSFERNLLFIREGMLEIIAGCVRERFVRGTESPDVAAVTRAVSETNPMRYPPALAAAIYEKAMKDFLYAAFSGMSATKAWNGVEQVNGGYIVVKPDGEVLCYHANDREEFREYLFRTTKFDSPSTQKCGWSYIQRKNGEYLLPINFTIRFKQ